MTAMLQDCEDRAELQDGVLAELAADCERLEDQVKAKGQALEQASSEHRVQLEGSTSDLKAMTAEKQQLDATTEKPQEEVDAKEKALAEQAAQLQLKEQALAEYQHVGLSARPQLLLPHGHCCTRSNSPFLWQRWSLDPLTREDRHQCCVRSHLGAVEIRRNRHEQLPHLYQQMCPKTTSGKSTRERHSLVLGKGNIDREVV